MGRFCGYQAQATGLGICNKTTCDGCKHKPKVGHGKIINPKGQQNRIGVGTIRRPKTCAYLRLKIQQKRAHIVREQERVAILQELLDEQERT